MLMRCNVCGKVFSCTGSKNWGWRNGKSMQCSYTCMRVLEKGGKPKFRSEVVPMTIAANENNNIVSRDLVESLDETYGGLTAEDGEETVEIPLGPDGKPKQKKPRHGPTEYTANLLREAARLRREEGLTVGTIANRLGVNPKTLKNAIYNHGKEYGWNDEPAVATGAASAAAAPPSAKDETREFELPDWITGGLSAMASAMDTDVVQVARLILGNAVHAFCRGVQDSARRVCQAETEEPA